MFKTFKKLLNRDRIYQAPSSLSFGKRNILLYINSETNHQITTLLYNRKLLKTLEKNNTRLFVCAKKHPDYVLSENICFVDDKFVNASKEYMQMLVTDFSHLSIDFIASDRPIIFFISNTAHKKALYYRECLYNFTPSSRITANLIIHYIKNDFVLEDNLKDKNLAFIARNMAGNIEISAKAFY